eukprot:2641674-Rhodomonas_salina.1
MQAPRSSVRFAPDTKSISRLADDDFLQAFGAQKSRWQWGQAFNTDRTLHIDYAHAISLGYNKEGYYLVLVIDGVDFMWASPTRLKLNQEELLDDFISNSCIKIGKIRMDLDSTMSRSKSFAMWCAVRDIVMCPTAGYNHTMQARAESAIRITKEHVWCMLKHCNMPYRFWPWAVT